MNLRTSDLSVSYNFTPEHAEAGRQIIKEWNFGVHATTSQSICIPGWEICGNGPSISSFLRLRRLFTNRRSLWNMEGGGGGVHYTNVQWIRATLEGWLTTVTLGGSSRSIEVSTGCPQGGVLLPLLKVPCCWWSDSKAKWGRSLYSRICRWYLSSSGGLIS